MLLYRVFREFQIHRKSNIADSLSMDRWKGEMPKKRHKNLLVGERFALEIVSNAAPRPSAPTLNVILLTDFHLSQSNYLLLIHEMAAF